MLQTMSKGIPAHFIELDPMIARKAVEGYDNAFKGESENLEALYRQHKTCPRGCGHTMTKEFGGIEWTFGGDTLLPRFLMKCQRCGYCMNPFDGMTVETGTNDPDGMLIKTED